MSKSRSIFVSQPADPRFDHIGLGIEIVVPHMFHDHRFRNDPSRASHEIFQQGKLDRLKFDLLAPSGHLPREKVHGQIPHGQTGWFRKAACPPDQCLHPGKKLGESEGLGEIIIASGLKPLDPVVNGPFGAQDDDRRADLLFPHLFDEGQPIQFWQHKVDDGRVVGFG